MTQRTQTLPQQCPIVYNESGFTTKTVFCEKVLPKKALDKLTLSVETFSGFTKKYPLYRTVGEYIKLPRELVMKHADKFKITNKMGATKSVAYEFKITLYEGQVLIMNHLYENYFTRVHSVSGRAGCVLNLRAGRGKTYIAGGLIHKLGTTTLYVVQNKTLQKQILKELNFALKICGQKADCAVAYDKKKFAPNDADAPAVAVVIDKSLVKMPKEHLAHFGVVIYDEAHTMASPQNSEFLWSHQFNYQLGLTGTPRDREDGLDPLYHNLIGRVVNAEDIDGFTYDDVAFETEVEIINYHGPPEFTQNLKHETTGTMFVSYMYKQFLQDAHRNALILDCIKKLYMSGQYIYVFASERETLTTLKEMIPKTFSVSLPEVETFMGGTTSEQLQNITGGVAHIVLATYDYAGTGVSIAQMNSIIFATPRKAKMKQIIARILRRNGDTTIKRQIIDIVDAETGLKRQVSKRKIAYAFYGAKIIKSKISYKDIKIGKL